jgi:hypothetical protein
MEQHGGEQDQPHSPEHLVAALEEVRVAVEGAGAREDQEIPGDVADDEGDEDQARDGHDHFLADVRLEEVSSVEHAARLAEKIQKAAALLVLLAAIVQTPLRQPSRLRKFCATTTAPRPLDVSDIGQEGPHAAPAVLADSPLTRRQARTSWRIPSVGRVVAQSVRLRRIAMSQVSVPKARSLEKVLSK